MLDTRDIYFLPLKEKSPSSEDDYLANPSHPKSPIGKHDGVHHLILEHELV